MKILKTFMNTITALLIISMAVSAQGKQTVDKRVNNLRNILKLTEKQTGQLRQILIYEKNQTTNDFEMNKGNHEALNNAALTRRELTNKQIMNILTSDQKLKYEKIIKKQINITDERTQMLIQRLNLSNEQALKIQEVMLASQKQTEDIRKENSEDRRKQMMAMRSIMQNTDKRIEDILTDEQKEEYEKIKKERKDNMKKQMRGGGRRGGRSGSW